MKKELIAGGLLILLLTISLLNIHYINSSMDSLSQQVRQAGQLVDEGKTEEAAEVLQRSLEQWQSMDRYVHVMLRHDEIDPITDEYFALLDELDSGGDATSASFETLLSHFNELSEMESLSLSSIF